MRILPLVFLSATCFADPVPFTFQDNSDNEDGFIVEALNANQQWEEVMRLAPNITEFQAEADTHEAWRVRAFTAFSKSGPTNVVKKEIPEDPSGLEAKKPKQYGRYKSIHTREKRKT